MTNNDRQPAELLDDLDRSLSWLWRFREGKALAPGYLTTNPPLDATARGALWWDRGGSGQADELVAVGQDEAGATAFRNLLVAARPTPYAPVYNVRDYGALGDGALHTLGTIYGSFAAANAAFPYSKLSSSTWSVQQADLAGIMGAMNQCADQGGGIVYVPEGLYWINGMTHVVLPANIGGGVYVRQKCRLMGAGRGATTLKMTNAADAGNSHVVVMNFEETDCHVSDLTVDGNRANQTADVHGIRLHTSIRPRIERVHVVSAAYYGITDQSRDIDGVFEDIEVQDVVSSLGAGEGIDLKRTLRGRLNRCHVHGCGGRGMDIRGQDTVISNCVAKDNGGDGMSMRMFRVLVATEGSENDARYQEFMSMTNCSAIGNGGHGIWVEGEIGDDPAFRARGFVTGCIARENTLSGYYLEGSNIDHHVANCLAEGNTANGFSLNANNVATFRSSLVGCTARSNGADGFAAGSANGLGSTFAACRAEGNLDGFEVGGTQHSFLGCRSETNSVYGFKVEGSNHSFVGCSVSNNTEFGLFFNGADDCTVEGGFYSSLAAKNAVRMADGDRNTVIGAILAGAGTGVGILSTADATRVIGCNFTGVTGSKVVDVGTNTVLRDNIGYVTANKGATSVADGGTIAHGLVATPTRVSVTPSVAGEMASVTAVGSTTFTVALKTGAGAAGTTQTVYWEAEV